MEIIQDDLTGQEIIALLAEHMAAMQAVSPPESRHALDLEGLRQDDITFWSLWDGDKLAGCVALKTLDNGHGEIKSMRTAAAYLRRGVAAQLLQFVINEAKKRNYQKLSLETGSMRYFEPARKLYQKFGFEYCQPFASYKEDPNSVFMTKRI